MSRSISLRRSPKPGALTHTQVKVLRLTRIVASASPSTLGNDDELLARLHDPFEQRKDLLNAGNFLIGDQMKRRR